MIAFRNYCIKPIPTNRQLGKIIRAKNDNRERHENNTLNALVRFGHDIYLIKPSGKKGSNTADIYWCGEIWELKSVFGNKSETVYRQMKSASKQSQNIILDVSNSNRTIKQTARDVEYYLEKRSRGTSRKKVIIIDRNNYCIIRGNIVL